MTATLLVLLCSPLILIPLSPKLSEMACAEVQCLAECCNTSESSAARLPERIPLGALLPLWTVQENGGHWLPPFVLEASVLS